MKKYIFILITVLFITGCEKEINFPVEDITFYTPENSHINGIELQNMLDKYVKKGLVGVSVVIDDPVKGFWAGASGYASLEENIDMTKYHLHYSASISKMYIGAAIMLLQEDGLINLNSKMNEYLPSDICDKITNGNKITIYQLMSHSSGLYDWAHDPQGYFDFMNDPDYINSREDILSYLYNKPAEFEPGEEVDYCNSNMMVLAVVIDYITGKNHAYYLNDRIFEPLNLTHTYYKIQEGYPYPKGAASCYSNYYNNGKIINLSDIYGNKWGAMFGDDGIIASVYDYMLFAKSLFEGDLIQPSSLDIMKNWTIDEDEENFWRDGLAIGCWRNNAHTTWGMGHNGNSEAAGGLVYYFPEEGVTIALFTNTGTTRNEGTLFFDQLWPEITEFALQ